jgi:hypothetical protein
MLRACGNFQQPPQPCLGRSKPSCCISLPRTKLFNQRLGGYCAWPFDWVLIVSHTAHCMDLPGIPGGSATRIPGRNPLVTQEKHVFPTRPGWGSFRTQGREYLTGAYKDPWFDRAGRWLGLPSHRTTHHWTSSHGATWNPWCTHRQLILKRILFSVSLRQQQPSSRNLALLSAHENLYCVVVFFVLGPVAALLDICSKLVTNATYAERFSACLNSELSHTHFRQCHCKDACPTYSYLKINLCLGLSYHLKKFGHKVFPHVYKAFGEISYRRLSYYITPNLVQIVSANVLNCIGCDFNSPVPVVSESSLK